MLLSDSVAIAIEQMGEIRHDTSRRATATPARPDRRRCRPETALLLAHGAGGSVEANYGPILDRLAAARTVIGIDYPGTGQSPRSPRPLELDDLADELVAAADAEGVDRFALAGFSLGGPVAIRAAARHPERVSALVLTATFAYPDQRLRLAASIWHDLCEGGDTHLLAEFLSLIAFSTEALDGFGPQQTSALIDLLSGQSRPVPRSTLNSSVASTCAATWTRSPYPLWSSPPPETRWCHRRCNTPWPRRSRTRD